MFRSSLNQPPVMSKTDDAMEEVGDEYYEFDGAKLEIKHNATIRRSELSIEPKITSTASSHPSVLEGSDSIYSPSSSFAQHDSSIRMADDNNSGKDNSFPSLEHTNPSGQKRGRF